MEAICDLLFDPLPITTIKESLRGIGHKVDDKHSREQLIEDAKQEIIHIGIDEIVSTFSPKTVAILLQQLGLDNPDDEEKQIQLAQKIREITLTSTLEKISEELLRMMIHDLGLGEGSVSRMRKMLLEETIVSGVEAFLILLTTPILKKYCAHLSIKQAGKKQETVEKLVRRLLEIQSSTNKENQGAPSKTNAVQHSDSVLTVSQKMNQLTIES